MKNVVDKEGVEQTGNGVRLSNLRLNLPEKVE